MEDPEMYAVSRLELCTYRYLQKIAKSMSLPSNVKKVYLIEMIHAKKFSSDREVDAIITRVLLERKQQARMKARAKKKRLQGLEISSTSNSQSPPLTDTPKHSPHYLITYPSHSRSLTKYQQRPNSLLPITKKCIESDRILRSFNTRMRPNYSFLNVNNSVLGVIKAQTALERSQSKRERQFQLLRFGFQRAGYRGGFGQKQKKLAYGECVTEIQHRNVEFADDTEKRELMPATRTSNVYPGPGKRQRRLSGIYPLKPSENCCRYTPSVDIRRQDGRISKINTIIQKNERYKRVSALPKKIISLRDGIPRVRVTVQDVINYNIERSTSSKSLLNVDLSRNSSTDSANSGMERRILTDNLNRNYGGDFERENLNRSAESGHYLTEYLSIYTQTKPYVQRRSNLYSESRNYTPEMLNRVTESQNYEITNRYPEQNIHNDLSENANNSDNLDRNAQADYTLIPALTDVYPNHTLTDLNCNDQGQFSVFYHKKIQSEQRRAQRTCTQSTSATEGTLPSINDVFRQFNDAQYKNLIQPLNVQVSKESERLPFLMPVMKNNKIMLESIYNFKNKYITNVPVLQVVNTTGTKCVYSTSTVTTAVAHRPAAPRHQNNCNVEVNPAAYQEKLKNIRDIISRSYHIWLGKVRSTDSGVYEQPNQNQYIIESQTMPRLNEYLLIGDQEATEFVCDEVLSSSSSIENNLPQELGANVTIPEMVEDALELISQDGDYMERIEMDVRIQCFLCDWAGPKNILEYHIRNEHPSKIVDLPSSEWSVSFPVCSLLSGAPTHHFASLQHDLFILSAWIQTDCFVVVLSIFTAESEDIPKYSRLTVYSNDSTKAYVWEGEIPHLSENTCQTGSNGLKLDITSLNLLPNNVKVVNGEIVSTSEAAIGQSENEISIKVYVNIFD